MGGGGEDRHAGADLGNDVLGGDDAGAGHGVQLLDLAQVLLGYEGAIEGLLQPGDLAAHGAPGQLGQRRRVTLPGGDRLEHRPAGDPVDVRDHRR